MKKQLNNTFNEIDFVSDCRIRNDFNIVLNISKIRNDNYVKIVQIVDF